MTLALGIDLGTSGVRVAVLDESGHHVATAWLAWRAFGGGR